MDVGTGSVPLDDTPFKIPERDRPSAKPAVLAVCAAQSILRFIGFAGLHASHPVRQASFLVFPMQILQPTKSNCGACRSASVFVKSAADVVPRSVGLPAEDDIGRGLHNRV